MRDEPGGPCWSWKQKLTCRLGPGDVQWMTAGKGIMHSEMPYFEDENSGDAQGMQLWIDLPKEQKFCEPSYQEKKATE